MINHLINFVPGEADNKFRDEFEFDIGVLIYLPISVVYDLFKFKELANGFGGFSPLP